jgi:hypothetical protein
MTARLSLASLFSAEKLVDSTSRKRGPFFDCDRDSGAKLAAGPNGHVPSFVLERPIPFADFFQKDKKHYAFVRITMSHLGSILVSGNDCRNQKAIVTTVRHGGICA